MKSLTFESLQTLTQDEFAEWIDGLGDNDLHRYDLMNGRVVMEPPAGWPHGEAELDVGFAIYAFVKERGCGRVFGSSQGFELPSGDTVAADVAFVSHERWAQAGAPRRNRFLRVVPDLVVEVMSPGTGRYDRGEKKAIYERNGVRVYWLLDLRRMSLTQFVMGEDDRFDTGTTWFDEDVVESAVLPGLRVRVADLVPKA